MEDEEDHSDLFIKKVETNHENNDEEEHLLQRSYHRQLQKLNIFVDEIILYELDTQVETEENKRKQIGEKLNKF